MPASFRADYEGIGAMLTSEFMRAAMAARAQRVEQVAKATAPVDEKGPHPGRYRDSIDTRTFIREPSGGRTRRVVARVEATAPEALFVEFGTRHQEAHRTLGRALDAAGN
jgi:HK97 gp10 family phage protein